MTDNQFNMSETMSNTLGKISDAMPDMKNVMPMIQKVLSNPFLIVLVTFIITAVLYALIRLLINNYNTMISKQDTEPILIKEVREASRPHVIPGASIPDSSDGGAYTMSVWLFVNEFERGRLKHVLHKGNLSNNQPAVWLHPDTNNLIVDFKVNRDSYIMTDPSRIMNSLSSNYKLRNAQKVFVNSNYEEKHSSTIRKFPRNIVRKGQYTVQDIEDWCEKDHNDCVGFFGVIDASSKDNMKEKNIEYAVIPSDKDNNLRFGLNPLYKSNSSSLQGTFLRTAKENIASFPGTDTFDTSNSIEVKNIPLGRWFHVAIVAKEQMAEVYIDGSLQESKVLRGSIENNNGDLYITQNGGFDGLLTQLRYFNHAITHDEVRKIYTCGPDCWQWPSIQKAKERAVAAINRQASRIEEKVEDAYNSASSVTDSVIDNIY